MDPSGADAAGLQSKEGVVNVSPYSYFNAMSHDPPHIAIGAAPTVTCLPLHAMALLAA